MRLTFHNDKPPSPPASSHQLDARLLQKLAALDSKARRKGLDGLNASQSPLVAIGMECDAGGSATKNGYGLFHLSWLAARHPEWASGIVSLAAEIKAAIRAAHSTRLRFLIWAGMGGSAEDKSAYLAAGLLSKGPKVYILDSTDPAKLKAILADIEARAGSLEEGLKSTLVAGMALGMTSFEPVLNLEKLAKLYDTLNIPNRANFVYLTLPGSLLDRFASERGYRKIELQPDGGNTTSGRHSSPLTLGSLLPLALAGVDLNEWLEGTFLSEDDIEQAFSLASFLHAHGAAGRDKVTFLASKLPASASLWTKQNFEESLGKSEHLGIKIIIGEPVRLADYRAPRDPRQDRIFLAVERKGEAGLNRDKLSAIKRSGYPVAHLVLDAGAPLSRYMQFIHYTVFALGWIRRMNFVTQPGVELYKSIAQPIYEHGRVLGSTEATPEWQALKRAPRQARWRNLTLYYDKLRIAVGSGDRDAPAVYAAMLSQLAAAGAATYGELTFFGDTRYDAAGRRVRAVLNRAAAQVFRSRLRLPADVYEGPAMNHSFHEMIIGRGGAFSTVIMSESPASIPKAGYTAAYHKAQFLATQMALEQRARPVVSILLKDLSAESVSCLDAFFREAARLLRR